MTFEQEFKGLLKKHGIEFDPQYVFVSVATYGARGLFTCLPRPSGLG
jgi:hypothetical protein